MSAHGAMSAYAWIVSILWLLALPFLWPILRERYREVAGREWALLGLLLASVLLLERLVLHSVWHTNGFGFSQVAAAETGELWRDQLALPHGLAHVLWLRALTLVLAPLSGTPFHANFLISTASVLVFFLLVRGATRRQPALVAFAATALFAWLPVRLRVGASASAYPMLEFLSLAMLLGLLLFADSGRRRPFLWAMLSLALLFHTHAETWFLSPALAVLFLVLARPAALRPLLRDPWLLAALATTLAAGATTAALHIRSGTTSMGGYLAGKLMQRIQNPLSTLLVYSDAGPRPVSALLDPGLTPLPFIGAALLGLLRVSLAAFRDALARPLALFLLLSAAMLYGFYTLNLLTLSDDVRLSIPYAFAFAWFAGFGVASIAGLARRYAWWCAGAVLLGALGVTLSARQDLLQASFAMNEEQALMAEAFEALPDGALVVTLPSEPAERFNTRYPYTAWNGRRGLRVISTEDYRAGSAPEEAFFYRSRVCYLRARCGERYRATERRDLECIHPACATMFTDYSLEPLLERSLTRKSFDFDGDYVFANDRVVGLYRIKGSLNAR